MPQTDTTSFTEEELWKAKKLWKAKNKAYKHMIVQKLNENNIDYDRIDFNEQNQGTRIIRMFQTFMNNDIAEGLEDCILYADINVNEYLYNILLKYKKINEWNIIVIYRTLLYNKDSKYLSDIETTMFINIFKEKIYDVNISLIYSLYDWNKYKKVIDDSIFKGVLAYKKITQDETNE